MSKRVTSSDVAERAGVSQATVSLVLSGTAKNISPDTAEAVKRAAAELGYEYRPKPRKKRSTAFRETIAIISASPANPYYSELLTSIEKSVEEANFLSIVCNTYRNPQVERAYMERMLAFQPAGIIFTYLPLNLEMAQQLSLSIPAVIVGDKSEKVRLDAVEFNSFAAGQLVAQHLIGLGHRQFAFISTPLNTGNIARVRRLEGISSTLKEYSLHDDLLIRSTQYEANDTQHDDSSEYSIGYALAKEALKHSPKVTAFIGVNDMIAYGIRDALLDRGLSIPRDCSVCGFDNISFSSHRSILLTTVDYYSKTNGKNAFELLQWKRRSMSGKKSEPAPFFRMEYEPQLVVRNSTGPCPR